MLPALKRGSKENCGDNTQETRARRPYPGSLVALPPEAVQRVCVSRMSAYQAQFSPSDSSSFRSRPPTSIRAECKPRGFHGSVGARVGQEAASPPELRVSIRQRPSENLSSPDVGERGLAKTPMTSSFFRRIKVAARRFSSGSTMNRGPSS